MPSSTDRSHVIRTSQQWESAIDKYSVIPWGVLCIELTPDGKTKAKVGEGNKFYSQLPYISDEIDLSKYYTKDEVDLIIENLEFMSIKETVPYASRNSLPRTGNKLGDVRFVKNLANPGDDPLMYIWNGTKWVFSGGSIIDIDLSDYAKKSEVYPRLQQLEALSHAHRNKDILDETSAVYTVEKDEKLASLKNYDVFVPATATTDGEEGLVPAPLAGEQSYYLRGDGTWAKVKSGDKYKAGDGIYILAGDASSTTLPVEIYAKANKLKQYVLYGGENPVGDWDSTLSKYAVVIKVSAEGMSDISTSLFLDDPIGNGDYIDYENQRFVHTRTNIRFDVRSGEWGRRIHADGTTTGEYTYQDRMAPSDYIAVSSEYVYLYYPGDMHGCDEFGIPCYAALYDENKVFTRSILLRSFTEVTIEPQPGEAYMRVSFGYYQGSWYRLTKIGEVITPIVLPPVIIYTNKVNTIDVMTTNKPIEVYFETAVVEDTSEDPMSEYTGIIYNDGVLDITQEDPNALNELTVHFRESDKVITIPAGGSTYTAGDGIDIDANDEISAKLGSGLRFDANGAIEVTGGGGSYTPGNGINITNDKISVKIGDGLSFDNNDAITVDEMTGATALANGASGTVPAPLAGDDAKFLRGDGSWAEIEASTKYVEGDAIEFGHPGMTDLGFDFDKFVSKFTKPNNGIVSVDSANKAFTLTATGSDCYTSPWTGGSLYTIPVIAGRKYRLTWDSNAPNVSGSIFAFENGDTSHMHSVNQSVQNYLEFTADTNSNVNFRFGVRNSGDSITYSNIKFYEVDNGDPNTNIINVKYGDGLSLDNNNALQVNAGDCLEIDANNNINVDISRTTIFFNNNPNS